jgi:TatD DNase family protein
MNLVDTHCHIHESDFPLPVDEVLAAARVADVEKICVVGTSLKSSREAIEFAKNHENIFAILGVHPHEVVAARTVLIKKVVGVGEIGLDYFYEFSPRKQQITALEQQLQIAADHNLPVSFHVRDGAKNGFSAFDDFWPIFDNFHYENGANLRGVLHSFTDNSANMEKGLARGLYFGVNGIATFNREENLKKVHQTLPLDRILLETDAPYLAPIPFRGQPNQPAFIPKIVEFLSDLRGESYDEIAQKTSENAEKLFGI